LDGKHNRERITKVYGDRRQEKRASHDEIPLEESANLGAIAMGVSART
jgi:hypothetical protein